MLFRLTRIDYGKQLEEIRRDNKEFKNQIIRLLNQLNLKINDLIEIVNVIKDGKVDDMPPQDHMEQVIAQFPISNVEQLNDFEEFLQNADNSKQLVSTVYGYYGC